MILEGLLIAVLASNPIIEVRGRAKYYRRKVVRVQKPPIEDRGPVIIRTLNCYNATCSTFNDMWQDRIMQWSK